MSKHTQILKLPFLMLLWCLSIVSYAQQTENFAANRLVVKFRTSAKPVYSVKRGYAAFSVASVDKLNKKRGCTSARALKVGGNMGKRPLVYVLNFSSPVDVLILVKAYTQTGKFEYVEPDYVGTAHGTTETTPNDPHFSKQWSLYNNGIASFDSAIIGADISMKKAWDIEKGDTSIIVAVIDGGAKMDHPEFAGRIWRNYDEIQGNGIDDDANGYVDDFQGWNFAYDINNPADETGHGTNVAGIIGANGNNSIGLAGVDWYCKLMILKGLDTAGFGYYTWWAEAMTYAADNGAKVINMSIGGTSSSTTLQNAVNYANSKKVTMISTTGNGNTSAPNYPGACTNIIAVGATNNHDCRVNPFSWGGGSNYGTYISLVAPGNRITGLSYTSNTNYTSYWGGTSQAAPHVAGVAALLLAQNPARTPAQIKTILETTAEDLVGNPLEDLPGWDMYHGHGRLNAYAALSWGLSEVSPLAAVATDVKLFPNPTTAKVFVKMGKQHIPANYAVINVAGAVALNGVLRSSNEEIDLGGLPKGSYVIRLNGDNLNFAQMQVLR